MIQIKLLRGCLVPGYPLAQPGDILTVPDQIGADLISMHRAEPSAPVQIETREPVLENRDPVPSITARRKLFARHHPK